MSFEDNLIYVENAFKDEIIYDDNLKVIGHNYTDGDLKTEESYRVIPISPRLKKMLSNMKAEKILEKSQQNKSFNENEYVFLNTTNTPFVAERLTNKMPKFIKKYNLEHMTVYGLRHSFATLNSEKGMSKEVLRELMGHSDFSTTDFYYIHISNERKKKEYERIHGKHKEDLER